MILLSEYDDDWDYIRPQRRMICIRPGYAGNEFVLPENAIIADIGSGHNPLPEATYCIERDFGESPQRAGNKTVIPNCKLILADVEKGIPLPDKSCDFVVASHILEHVDNPIAFCKELSRIGKEGYIETPGVWQERIRNTKVHKWYVRNNNGVLECRRKNLEGREYTGVIERLQDLIEYNIFSQTCYHWKDTVNCRIIK